MKLLKEPGYIYDLLFVFFLKFNHQYCIDNFVNGNKQQKDEEYLKKILEEFSPISDDLYVFFHTLENGRCFIATKYFSEYKELFDSEYNFNFLMKKLSDYDKVIKRLIKFYFHDSENELIDNCFESKVKLFECIKNSNYSAIEKSKLYEFFIDPVTYIQKLQYELMEKNVALNAYYEKNYSVILDVYRSISFEVFIEQIKPLKDLAFLQEQSCLKISFCLINKNCINHIVQNNGVFCLLGYDYIDILDFLKGTKNEFKLEDFAYALAEASRVQMLELMYDNGEINRKDLERIFNFSGSTAYHHLTILLKSGIIKTRNEGKTVMYSINNKQFDVVKSILNKYSSKGKRNNT